MGLVCGTIHCTTQVGRPYGVSFRQLVHDNTPQNLRVASTYCIFVPSGRTSFSMSRLKTGARRKLTGCWCAPCPGTSWGPDFGAWKGECDFPPPHISISGLRRGCTCGRVCATPPGMPTLVGPHSPAGSGDVATSCGWFCPLIFGRLFIEPPHAGATRTYLVDAM